jgi:starch synthase (maltosyl-transferring)
MQVPTMWPRPGEHLLRYVGDRLQVRLSRPAGLSEDVRAFLRTNLTRAEVARAEVIARAGLSNGDALTFAGASWRDVPLALEADEYVLDLPLLEVGHFRAKAYLRDARGRQWWPEGGDIGISVHPDALRTANIIYCVFPRTIGQGEAQRVPRTLSGAVTDLDERGYTVIPPSGTLRGLLRSLPHVFDRLGCRIVHLLPIGPVPSTYARMGRYGSPYAQLDLTGIDPALIEFDKRTTGVEQFRELADGVHLRDGLLLLDIVLNHTGWSSRLLEEHPDWFKRDPDGHFHSPGAWGVTWADLVELDQSHAELWEVLADSLITWCKRGVDGFRCDAGYMIPLPAWQYIVARVRAQYPNCLFLLEGLGGAWEATERLLTDGGMQWAYSELFQCFEPRHVAEYLDHANAQSRRIGILTHYSETHDNERLATRGPLWSSLRNHLCALSSHAGSFGYSAGVEWLCTEKVDVHEARSLGWGAEPNQLEQLSRLARLLRDHPCFFDGAQVERVSELSSPVLALVRISQDGRDRCLVLVNFNLEASETIVLTRSDFPALALPAALEERASTAQYVDLLGQQEPAIEWSGRDVLRISLPAGHSCCLAEASPHGLAGDTYRLLRAQAAWAYAQLSLSLPHEALGPVAFDELARLVAEDPVRFLACLEQLRAEDTRVDLLAAIRAAREKGGYANVVRVRAEDHTRVTLVPPGHFILFEDAHPFEANISLPSQELHLRSTPIGALHVVALGPDAHDVEHDVPVRVARFGRPGSELKLSLRRLSAEPRVTSGGANDLLLLSNGRGAMARFYTNLGHVRSKYDCLLGANLDADLPVNRHVAIKRVRAWVNADGFITPLDGKNLSRVEPGAPAQLCFLANAGEGRRVAVTLTLALLPDQNVLAIQLARQESEQHALLAEQRVSVTLRFDLEDRDFHQETTHTESLAAHFAASVSDDAHGFRFAPHEARVLSVATDRGEYHRGPEWSFAIEHDLDRERGQAAHGAAFSPGWFELPLLAGKPVTLTAALATQAEPQAVEQALRPRATASDPSLLAVLRSAVQAFVVKRGSGRTVIAGYPWFLDWGRDTFVAARGLIAAGLHADVRAMLLTYAALERDGTLPNYLAGAGEGSRETSDAPFWFSLACEELAREVGPSLYSERASDGRNLREVLVSIAEGLLSGTSNGVHVDRDSGLVFSPPHFTWMDTNYPAGTPREGYPIELAAMWLCLLRQLARNGVASLGGQPTEHWVALVQGSLDLFWREEHGFFSDTLHAQSGTPARAAQPDDHLRPNQLLAVSLGLVVGERAERAVDAATRFLLVPGALRTLAPRPVHVALPIRGVQGALLNDPSAPYWGHYVGDEDTRRKPAYHNGTAWPWWLATYCEALAAAYPGDARARVAALAILGSCARLLSSGCLHQLAEILDGDAPHQERGCDAQAWSVSETLRGLIRLTPRA